MKVQNIVVILMNIIKNIAIHSSASCVVRDLSQLKILMFVWPTTLMCKILLVNSAIRRLPLPDHHHHCDLCHLRFATKHKLKEHMQSVHQQDIMVDKMCSQCGVVQKGLTDYYSHLSKEVLGSSSFVETLKKHGLSAST